jgi:two-component system, LytTR family, response regulator LytT
LEKIESIATAIQWLKKYTADLIFMDIHLSDGLCFSIFDQINIDTPVIFTTAYDAYAIKAFKVNSIDYLLKPIDEDDLRISITKYKALSEKNSALNIEKLKAALSSPPKIYQERFMVQRGEKLLSIVTNEIAYFEGEDRYVFLVKKDGTRFIIDYKLSDLEEVLNPSTFYRLNRSFITSFEAIKSMVTLSKSRVKVELMPDTKREVIVSSDNNQKYKKWLNL